MKRSRKSIIMFIVILGIVVSQFSSITFAKPSSYIDGLSGIRDLYDLYPLGQSGSPHYGSTYKDTPYSLEIHPGEELRIPLTADMFIWANGRTPLPMESILLNELKNSRVTVRTHVRSGSEVLDYVQLDKDTFYDKIFFAPGRGDVKTSSTAYISIIFTDKFPSVEEVDFEFHIYLAIDGQLYEETRITINGTMKNPEFEADYKLDSANISDGTVLNATTYIPSVDIDLGKGVTLTKNLFKGKKYYGITGVKPATDPALAEEDPFIYPSIIAAYKIEGINLDYGNGSIKIDPKYALDEDELKDSYYVYNRDLEYLGTTKEDLPYSDFYFLATEEVETLVGDGYEGMIEAVPTSREEMQELLTGEDEQMVVDKDKSLSSLFVDSDGIDQGQAPVTQLKVG